MTRRLDGLSLPHSDKTKKHKSPRRRRRWLTWAVLAILMTAVSLTTLWAEPILAALPFNVSEKVALARLAKPGVYLVLFQNERELRPTGGFLGSFAEVEIGWGGHLKAIQVETNIYRRDHAYAAKLGREAPEPMREFLGETPWALRDSNWALDFPEAAQEVSWFYSHEGGREVDGVIALDARLLERLLKLTGPITLVDYDTELTAENVVDQLMNEIEQDYWLDPTHTAENQPKTILADLAPVLIEKIRAISEPALLGEVVKAFAAKEILVYHRDPSLAAAFARANWDGHVAKTADDILYVNEANLTPVNGRAHVVGAKSSWSIERTASLTRTPVAAGGSHHTLLLTRHHRGQNVWPDGPNASYLRIAVPAGSTLLSASRNGLDITAEVRFSVEAGITVFGFWSKLNPGEREDVRLDYQTPTAATTDLLLERQPGMPAYPVKVFNDVKQIWQGSLTTDQLISATRS